MIIPQSHHNHFRSALKGGKSSERIFFVPRLLNLHKITSDGIGEQYSVNRVPQGGQRMVLGPPRVVSSQFFDQIEVFAFCDTLLPPLSTPRKNRKSRVG